VDDVNDHVYVADPRNQRIQVFDRKGSFINKWSVKEWEPSDWIFQHLVFDAKRARLYASSQGTNEVLVFDLHGREIGSLKPQAPDKLEGASAMALVREKLYVLCTFSNRVSEIDLAPPSGRSP
jgi:DNA-binding beta-propeller fold protein YncE